MTSCHYERAFIKFYIYKGGPKKPWNLFIKIVYSYMFKLQSPSKYSPFHAIHLLRRFFHCSKTVFELVDFDAFQCFCHFCSTYSTWAKPFPLRTCFIRKNRKSHQGRYREKGEGGCTCKSPVMKWANTLEEFKKNSLKPNTASHNNTSWYTDTGESLEHSPGGRSLYYKGPTLQKIIPLLGGSLLIYLSKIFLWFK